MLHALYEQYRPTQWRDVVGQGKTLKRIETLRRRGLSGRAYWLSGQSGPGKTTIARLIAAAEVGPVIESIAGVDRAAMYVLLAWTGYRKKEIGSLTLRSLWLDGDPPTGTVQAAYSKRKRQDT